MNEDIVTVSGEDGGSGPDGVAEIDRAYRLHSAELMAFAAGLVGRIDAEDVVSRAMAKALGSGAMIRTCGWRLGEVT